MRFSVLLILLIAGCSTRKIIQLPLQRENTSGTELFKTAFSYNYKQRDSLAVYEFMRGNIPDYIRRFVPVKTEITGTDGNKIKAIYFVSPDYLSIGRMDWVRIPITPMAAQTIADSIDCFLPTRKMVDDIYQSAKVKLDPVPMYAFRDSTPTMYHHHLIIEGQRKGRNGLIAGIKKDVVVSGKISRDFKQNRVAIYGWHLPNGKPIQPLYTGHVDWYVDYSHGVRLVYRKIKVDGKWMDYVDILNNDVLRTLLCDEEYCDYYKYSY